MRKTRRLFPPRPYVVTWVTVTGLVHSGAFTDAELKAFLNAMYADDSPIVSVKIIPKRGYRRPNPVRI